MTSPILLEDLIREIASYRTNPLSLCLVSRYILTLAEPFLFEDIDISPTLGRPNGENNLLLGQNSSQWRLHSVLNRIFAQPHLGHSVRNLSIFAVESNIKGLEDLNDAQDSSKDWEKDLEMHVEVDPELFHPSKLAAARKIGLTEGFMHAGGCNAETILLLHLVPNLKTLRIVPLSQGPRIESPSAGSYLYWAARGCIKGGVPRGLQSVTRIHFPAVDMLFDSGGESGQIVVVTLEAIAELMALPSLRSIHGRLNPSTEAVADSYTTLSKLKHSSGVTDLFLSLQSFDFTTLDPIPRAILSLPKSLRRLTIHKDIYLGTPDPFQCLLDEIFSRRDTLEYLELKIWTVQPWAEIPMAVSFAPLLDLRHLVITTNILFGDPSRSELEVHRQRSQVNEAYDLDVFLDEHLATPLPPLHELIPRSLETLEIWFTTDWDLAFLFSLNIFGVWKQSSNLGNLKRVVLHYQAGESLEGAVSVSGGDDWDWLEEQKRQLRRADFFADAFRAQGLEVYPF